MPTKPKKYVIRALAIVMGLFAVVVLVIVVLIVNTNRRFKTFERDHANSKQSLSESIRPALEWKPTPDPVRETSPTLPAASAPDLSALETDYEKFLKLPGNKGRPYYGMRMALIFAAADYPEEGTTGTPPCQPALRRDVLEQVAIQQAAFEREYGQLARAADAPTTYASALQPMVARAAGLLEQGKWPYPMDLPAAHGIGYLGKRALFAALDSGRRERAAAILLNTLRLKLILDFERSFQMEAGYLDFDELLFVLAHNSGWEIDAALAEAAALLARSRLAPAQQKELRAQKVLGVKDFFWKSVGQNERNQPGTFGYMVSSAGNSLLRNTIWALLSPTGKAWADGDLDAYNAAADRIGAISQLFSSKPVDRLDRMVYNVFDPDSAGFRGDHPFNREVDRMQVMIAVARFRHAEARYPENLSEIIPRFLKRSDLSGESAWDVERMPTGSYPDKRLGKSPASNVPLAERPVLFNVRRMTLRKEELLMYGSTSNYAISEGVAKRIDPKTQTTKVLFIEATCFQPELIHAEFK